MKILLAYFSATGNTARIAKTVSDELKKNGAYVEELDITTPEARQSGLDFAAYDGVFFGTPVYACRTPRVVREWLAKLEGQGRKCSTFFTYGGFTVDPVHYTTRQILVNSGFTLISSAQFLGAHTFNFGGWQAMVGRPDENDLISARDYACRTLSRFSVQKYELPLDLPIPSFSEAQFDDMENNRFKAISQLPTRGGAECSMCMLCEELCPSGTMDAQSGEVSNAEACLCCLRCVSICPEGALQINDLHDKWVGKLAAHHTNEKALKEQQSKLYF